METLKPELDYLKAQIKDCYAMRDLLIQKKTKNQSDWEEIKNIDDKIHQLRNDYSGAVLQRINSWSNT